MKRLLLLLLFLAAPLQAEPRLVTDMSQSRIDISYRFAGAELLIFGAIQYPGGIAPEEAPGIAVVLRGPMEPLTVRKKARVAGIWVNTEAVRFESAPGFYAVATTKPVRDLLDERNAAIYEIGLQHLQLSPATATDPETTGTFQDGLVALRTSENLFVEQPYGVLVTDRVLYRARLPIPSAVPVGNYQAEIYLILDGKVRARSTAPVIIDKTGFERDLFVFAHKHSFFYGLLAVMLALLMGWVAGEIGRRSQP
ncbi:TIGR02186 family protein [Sandaracinobacteroides hominis]|uniref:TIGR02186 family protein n=1 Tax=Sandaracinobacteroides hominis TaxID=2780086 RepID=UPI0018F3082E|nr:TIGR02186 family protein [Sandaracinobacteroides hominis]